VTDRLEHLLKRADAPPPAPREADVGERVRRRARRNDRIRSTFVTATVLIVIAVGAITLLQPSKKKPIALLPESAATQAELNRLNQEALRHAAIADQLMQIELTPRQPDPTELARNLQRQRDEAALSLIYQAEALAPIPAQRPAAVALYQKAIDLFPQTHWAPLAKQRIEALHSMQENL
jgi:hypothetical protein